MNRKLGKNAILIALLLMGAALISEASIGETSETIPNSFSASSVPRYSTQWNKTYGGTGDDVAYSVVQANDGGYMLAGSTTSFGAGGVDAWLVKTDSDGNILWNKTYGGRGDDYAYSMIQTVDRGYALAGSAASFGASTCAWLVKTDSAGNMQWNHVYGEATGINTANSVVQTSDGGYALAGSTTSFGAGGEDFWLVKTDSDGNMLWNQTYGGTGDEIAHSIIQTRDGDAYALGGSTSFGAGGTDAWLVQTDEYGNMQWNQTYGGTGDDYAYSVVQMYDNGYALAGTTKSFGVSAKAWLVRTDRAGNIQWNQTYGGTGDGYAYDMVHPTENFLAGGFALAGICSSGAGGNNAWLVKTDGYGNMQWSKTYGGLGDGQVYSVVQAFDYGYALAGFTTSSGIGADFYLIKIVGIQHDVGVSSIVADKTVIGEGFSGNVTIYAVDTGGFDEMFDVTAYANATLIGTQHVVNLYPAFTMILTFMWNTTGVPYGNYTLSAHASPVPDELDTSNNNLTASVVKVTIPGDVDGDFKVSREDLVMLANAYEGDIRWNANADIDGNNNVGLLDLVILANHYGQHYP